MSARVVHDADELASLVGEEIGVSDWLEMTQHRIDTFADATRDHQWIHVDPERAATGPYGASIAHGYLTLSLLPSFGFDVYALDFGSAKVNYGVETVRFPNAVRVGTRVRGRVLVESVDTVAKGIELKTRFTVEIEGETRPACVATQITLIVP